MLVAYCEKGSIIEIWRRNCFLDKRDFIEFVGFRFFVYLGSFCFFC